jgi:hypothetical protein
MDRATEGSGGHLRPRGRVRVEAVRSIDICARDYGVTIARFPSESSSKEKKETSFIGLPSTFRSSVKI